MIFVNFFLTKNLLFQKFSLAMKYSKLSLMQNFCYTQHLELPNDKLVKYKNYKNKENHLKSFVHGCELHNNR